jgi:hypothetical protein
MDFQNQYDTATGGINDIVSSQLTSSLQWSNIPGSLVKASASAAGYVWGYNSQNNVFMCQLPCTGNWTMVDTSKWNIMNVLDIVTDSTNVYILIYTPDYKRIIYSNSATGSGTWNMITAPSETGRNLFSTNTYLWIQGNSDKFKCAKPCTTGNWIESNDSTAYITSSSDSTLYGIDKLGNAVKTDENLQSGWSSISGLSGLKLMSVIGQADSTALYGVDTSSKAYQCEGDCSVPKDVDPLDTAGYTPLNITASGKDIWMTGTTSGDKGNIFNRIASSDYTTIMNNINPLDQTRDKVVSEISDSYNQETNLMVANKQITDVVNFFTKFFKFDKQSVDTDKSNISAYRDKLITTQANLDKITQTEPLLQKLVMLVGAVLLLYMVGSFMGPYVHTVAFVVLVSGLGYIIYSSG